MKINPLVLMLAGALVGALAWGNCSAGKASDASKALQNALAEHRDSLQAWMGQRNALAQADSALREQMVPLREAYKVSRILGQRGRDSITKLLAILPDSQRAPLETAITVIGNVGDRCDALLVNCELRVANAEARAHGDSLQLGATRLLLDSTEAMWHSAERRARPSFFRDLWRSRSVTLPLAALSAFLLVTKH